MSACPCKLCGRTHIKENELFYWCTNPDCSMDEVQLYHKEWNLLMGTKNE